jgi:hypothetical protein
MNVIGLLMEAKRLISHMTRAGVGCGDIIMDAKKWGTSFVVPACRNCQWWNGLRPAGFQGDCNHPKTRDCEHDCAAASSHGAKGEPAIVTGPNFGCIHFENKQQIFNRITTKPGARVKKVRRARNTANS